MWTTFFPVFFKVFLLVIPKPDISFFISMHFICFRVKQSYRLWTLYLGIKVNASILRAFIYCEWRIWTDLVYGNIFSNFMVFVWFLNVFHKNGVVELHEIQFIYLLLLWINDFHGTKLWNVMKNIKVSFFNGLCVLPKKYTVW
jgi:hypothetical protein